jgi:glycosyltransferase involved in cell wall biosynthesis
MYSDAPLVSAIMPTRGRSIWAFQALLMFLDQSWANKEIVILDDLDDRSFSAPPDFPGVRYHISEKQKTIGEKRNLCIERAAGEIIIHWDSDDLYSLDRMEHQSDMLISTGSDAVGYNRMTFVDEEKGQRVVYHGAQHYMIGVSMCYWKRIWRERPFPAKNVGEDNDFQFGRRLKTATCEAGDRIIARLHPDNSFDKWKEILKHPNQWVAA